MLFNSLSFTIFLPVVFFLYWLVTNKSLKAQNGLLLLASYFFYACWDWRFLFLLAFSTFLDYYTGLKMQGAVKESNRKGWFWLSILINVGFLGLFKYYNFFAQSFAEAAHQIGFIVHPWTIKIILPVGISFYTFHGLSYVIDIYKRRIHAEENFVAYAVFVSFFPLLVAGPIERANHLLPQIKKERTFDYKKAVDGLRQILWGLFKKIVIADQCAVLVNDAFSNAAYLPGVNLFLGAVFFAFQIYGDFSGYSDIALGTARLFGIELLRNFAFPYFSRDIAEFWRRWHISLSTWFRDYLYIPLGGSKGGTWIKIRNTFIIFLVSGFWHGANWTFIVWGALNAIFILPSIVFNTNRNNLDIVARDRTLPNAKELLQITQTFILTVLAWIFFRADTLQQAGQYIAGLFKQPASYLNYYNYAPHLQLMILLVLFMMVEWMGRREQFAIAKLGLRWHSGLRYSLYLLLIFSLFWYGGTDQQFIYFQF